MAADNKENNNSCWYYVPEDYENAKKETPTEIHKYEAKNERMLQVIRHVNAQLSQSTGTQNDESKDSRNRTILETLINDYQELEYFSDTRFLGQILRIYCSSANETLNESGEMERELEIHVLDKFKEICDKQTKIVNLKSVFDKAVLNKESARRRNAMKPMEETENEIKETDEIISTLKQKLITEMKTLADSDEEIAKLFERTLMIQLDRQQKTTKVIQAALTDIHMKISQPRHALETDLTTSLDILDKLDYKEGAVFGVPLKHHLTETGRTIALPLEVCCAALLETQGILEQGILRVSGNVTSVKKLKNQFDSDHLDLSHYLRDPHPLAGVLKCYLRELPEPLMTFALYKDWQSLMNKSEIEKEQATKEILTKMPEANEKNLGYLLKFLHRITTHHESNKMPVANVALVIGPNLMWNNETGNEILELMINNKLIEYLIANAEIFWPEEIDFRSSLIESLSKKPSASQTHHLDPHVRKLSAKSDRSGSLDSLLLLTNPLDMIRSQSSAILNIPAPILQHQFSSPSIHQFSHYSKRKTSDEKAAHRKTSDEKEAHRRISDENKSMIRKTSDGGILKSFQRKPKRRAPLPPAEQYHNGHLSPVTESHTELSSPTEEVRATSPSRLVRQSSLEQSSLESTANVQSESEEILNEIVSEEQPMPVPTVQKLSPVPPRRRLRNTRSTEETDASPVSPFPDQCPFQRNTVSISRSQSAVKPPLPSKPRALTVPVRTKL